MKTQHYLFTLLIGCLISSTKVEAQERTPHSSMWMLAPTASSTRVNYMFTGEGVERRIRWGMDTAWNDGNNVRRGAIHIGKENLGYGRLSFQPTDLVGDDLTLSLEQQNALKDRVANLKAVGTTSVLLNADPCDSAKLHDNYRGKPKNWYNVIKATTIEAQKLGMTIESIAPMNEPDYTYNGQGTKADFLAVVKLLRADSFFDDIRISAGNTLNTDGALEWYNYMKPYVNEGNTHQLAGSFDNYAKFFQTVRADGNVATADELHNTMEAFVGAEYGLQNGIWWGFDGVTRGRYCQATSGGRRLGYGESRATWTAGCVYRLPDGSVDAFIGSSERQANPNTFELASQDCDVFYDGYGPTRLFARSIPGGPAGSYGTEEQTNAECTIHITKGEDVANGPLQDGTYFIMTPNSRSRKIMSTGGNSSNGADITVATQSATTRTDELWTIEAVSPKVGGDFSYYYITNNQGGRLIDVKNGNLETNGAIIAYAGGKGLIEQWHFIYAGNGDYYIQSRHSGLFLGLASSSATNVTQRAFKATDRFLRWRLVPADTRCELTAPAAPVGLTAMPQPASVLLQWEANTETDLSSYIVLRGEATTETGENWQTIGRGITGTQFIDNSCEAGTAYLYKVKAVDAAGNRSADSELVGGRASGAPALIAHYAFDQTLSDDTENQFDAVCDIEPSYQTTGAMHKEGTAAIMLNSGSTAKHYLALPHEVGNQRQMTVAMWVRWRGGNAWQRIFDFGNSTDQYLFLTPSNGSGKLSLGIKNGGGEQTLTCESPLPTNVWCHVAATISDTEVKLYVNGEEWASTESITLRASDFRPGLNYIGRSQFAPDPFFLGYIDDIGIWNYALSAEDVLAVMQGQPTGIDTPSPIATSPVVATDYYTLDGQRTQQPARGLYIVKERRADGSTTVKKMKN
ncbi:MAG: LamG-like jellyroll fold domain-containing protein [Bacteroidales bacterium]|nr:LamG-like jellyroll fold domain-containing protein [Bacteroidales bacterium]